jgi:hypothetical protein
VGAHRKEVTPGRTRPGQVMQALYYDRDARPVSWQRWRQLGRQPGYSRAGYAGAVRHGRQVTVITFWSGIAAGRGPAGPLIFCTCARIRDPASPGPACQRQWRWPTPAATRAGHQAVTGWMAELAAFLAGHASQLPAPAPAPDLPGPPPILHGPGVVSRPRTTTA